MAVGETGIVVGYDKSDDEDPQDVKNGDLPNPIPLSSLSLATAASDILTLHMTLLVAFGICFVGFVLSPAVRTTVSVPTYVKAALMNAEKKPRKRPKAPGMSPYWLNGPGFFL